EDSRRACEVRRSRRDRRRARPGSVRRHAERGLGHRATQRRGASREARARRAGRRTRRAVRDGAALERVVSVESLERAFVAMSYLLGRGDALCDGLSYPGEAAARAATVTEESDRAIRARRLAAQIAPIVTSLEARRLA